MNNMEKFTQKIYGRTAKSMFNVLRNSGKISFVNDVIGLKVVKIIDGGGKYLFPDQTYEYIPLNERGVYYKVYLEDGSDYNISIDEESNSLIFDFNTTPDKLAPLRETILSFIDYDYGRKEKV
jgi:hypothetical protein